MAAGTGRRGSGDGINGAILATGLGSAGTLLEAELPETRRGGADVGKAASGTGAFQSRATGTKERFSRRGTTGETAGGPGTGAELRTRCGTAPLAHGDAAQASAEGFASADAEPAGGAAGRGPYQVVELRFGSSGGQRGRMMHAIAKGETDLAVLAAMADKRLRATSAQLCDALGACTELNPVYRQLIKMALEEVEFLEQQMGQLDQEIANLLRPHEDAVKRLAVVPGLGVDSAQQIIAEVGATAATFPSAKQLSSWVAICLGDDESAGVNHSHRSPKGNRQMRRLLNQAANAAVKVKGC